MILSKLNSMLIGSIIFRLLWFKGKQNYLSNVITCKVYAARLKSKSLAETDMSDVRFC